MSNLRRLAGGIFATAAVLAVLAVGAFRQPILDQFAVLTYQPSVEVSQLAERGGLSERGRFFFYVGRPELVDSAEFNEACPRVEESSPILGCYSPLASTIHIYNVADTRLDGIKEVTAAHEMLHVAYDRLSESERKRVDSELDLAYQRLKNPRLEERMAYYDRAEPGSHFNELHSIIPTEFSEIGSELERYYAKLFDDRQKIVALHKSYSSTFEQLENEQRNLGEALRQAESRIAQLHSQYNADIAQLNRDILSFNQRASSGGFSSESEFNAVRNQLVSRSSSLELRRRQLAAEIERYNSDVERFNSLGGQMRQLNQSLDSLEAVN
ncbi:hypothetical protein B7Y94_03115 [Candidatus Saccharibacteria bacterium 32-49-12]|nr:MAG: hypothetical protein B7Y94_03115 [Candidatus Saccharibacteria bacterium 32-49-12]